MNGSIPMTKFATDGTASSRLAMAQGDSYGTTGYLQPSVSPTDSHSHGPHDSGVGDVHGILPEFVTDQDPAWEAKSTARVAPHQATPTGYHRGAPHQATPTAAAQLPNPAISGHHVGAMAKRPDSFATRCHDYEELPSSRYMPAKYQYCEADTSDRLPHPPATRATSPHSTVGSTENLCETNRFHSTYRKRQNPLYDSVDREEKVLTSDKKKKSRCQVHCVALVVVALIAIVALVLVILRISGAGSSEPISTSSTNISQLAEALTKIEVLEEKYANLIYKHEQLVLFVQEKLEDNGTLTQHVLNTSNQVETLLYQNEAQQGALLDLDVQVGQLKNLTADLDEDTRGTRRLLSEQDLEISSLWKGVTSHNDSLMALSNLPSKVQLLESKLLTDVEGINEKLDKQDTRLSILNRNVTTGLLMLKDNLTTRIDTVSKMEGPRGPPGAGNLTACEHRQVKMASDFDFAVTRTSFMPQTESDSKKYVILGVDCSTQGGTESFLEANMMSTWNPSWPWQYRCNCSGQQQGATKRLCILYWWQCPRVS